MVMIMELCKKYTFETESGLILSNSLTGREGLEDLLIEIFTMNSVVMADATLESLHNDVVAAAEQINKMLKESEGKPVYWKLETSEEVFSSTYLVREEFVETSIMQF